MTRHGAESPPVPLVLDVLRHGEARPAESDGDAGRRLTDAGIAALERQAEWYAREGGTPDRVCASPLRRAIESARVAMREAAPELEPELWPELMPEGSPEDVCAALEELGDGDRHVLLVGHQPLLGLLVSWLAGVADLNLKPATLARLECDDRIARGAGRLLFVRKP
jgi:phosphohistidine phosphatase